jgi:uncharacterized protein
VAKAALKSDRTNPADRILWLDVLRGCALFGIAQVNFAAFASGEQPIAVLFGGAPTHLSASLYAIVEFGITAKFYPIFAFLFGYGHVLQRQGLERRGVPAETVLYRRYLCLLVIGMLHGTLLFFGDILTVYAVCGLVLTFSRQASMPYKKQALLWAMICVVQLTLAYSTGAPAPGLGASLTLHRLEIQQLADGQLGLVMASRASSFLSSLVSQVVFFMPLLMVLMSFGQWAADEDVWRRPDRHQRLFRRLFAVGLLIGVPLNVALVLISFKLSTGEHAGPWRTASDLISDVAFVLSFAYLGALGLWAGRARSTPLPRVIYLLSCTGRMALTNYLTQSILMGLIWYSCWPWLIGRNGYPCLSLIAGLICVAQVAWSYRRVQLGLIGPAEKLWRDFTYASLPER